MRVESTGMVCSIGLTAKAACAAIRAGIAGFDALPYCDERGKPVIGSPIPPFPADPWGWERLVDLLSRAGSECLGERLVEPLIGVPLLVALAECDRPGGSGFLADRIVREVERKLGVRFHPSFSESGSSGPYCGV